MFGMDTEPNDHILPAVFHISEVDLSKICVSKARNPPYPQTSSTSEQGCHVPFDRTPTIGRDADMFYIERSMFLQGPIGLIHGFPCTGKATLMDYLAEWWQRSGCVQHVKRIRFAKTWGDRTAPGSAQNDAAIKALLQEQKDWSTNPSSSPTSLVILQCVEALSEDQHQPLLQFLLGASRSNTPFVLLPSVNLEFCNFATANGCPFWLYDLGGLDTRDTLRYLSSCLAPAAGDKLLSSTDLRYLRRVLDLFGHNPVAMEALKRYFERTGVSPSQVFWMLQSHPLGLVWPSNAARDLTELFERNLPRPITGISGEWLPWPTQSGGLFFYDQVKRAPTASTPGITSDMMQFLTSPQMTRGSKSMDVLHPLLSEWIRQTDPNAERNRDASMRKTVAHYFNICRGFSTQQSRKPGRILNDVLRTVHAEFFNLVACMEFCVNTQASTLETDLGLALDLLWATCARAQIVAKATREMLENREILADVSTAVVMARLPRFRPFDSDAWDAYNGACLKEYANASMLSSLDIARIALHCLSLAKYSASSKATARPWILGAKQLLASIDLLGSEEGIHSLLRFLKCSAILLDTEIGPKKMSPLKELVDLSRKMDAIQLPGHEKTFIATWAGD